MNIANAAYSYRLESNFKIGIKATIDGQELFVPLDEANRHYAEIMRQVEAGDLVIEPAE
jgi:hypothetical protein